MLLAMDTSTRAVGVALYDGVRVLGESVWVSKNHHTIELAPSVAETLSRVGVDAKSLTAVGVAIGPGGFTGLRIGLALAKGLSLSRNLPLVGIPSLDVVAASQAVIPQTKLAAVIEAGRRRLAVGWYHALEGKWLPDGELQNLTLDEFLETIEVPAIVSGELSGEARLRLGQMGVVLPSPAQSVRRPAVLAELAWQRWKIGQIDNPETLSPIYLHHGEPIPG